MLRGCNIPKFQLEVWNPNLLTPLPLLSLPKFHPIGHLIICIHLIVRSTSHRLFFSSTQDYLSIYLFKRKGIKEIEIENRK
jgi:hypothetical protein